MTIYLSFLGLSPPYVGRKDKKDKRGGITDIWYQIAKTRKLNIQERGPQGIQVYIMTRDSQLVRILGLDKIDAELVQPQTMGIDTKGVFKAGWQAYKKFKFPLFHHIHSCKSLFHTINVFFNFYQSRAKNLKVFFLEVLQKLCISLSKGYGFFCLSCKPGF